MQSIKKSECPQELAPADVRTVVHVNITRKEQECPVRYLHLFDLFTLFTLPGTWSFLLLPIFFLYVGTKEAPEFISGSRKNIR